ncbi:MAG: hypothetical protein OXU31_09100 [Gammaproteobacteria bacterium]|nr:hypothetical protein [Gammaproteobacteria bacterium]MDD9798985.1 hypothetical protein [Gammaproteobacteria bacterium]MDD9816104.1 hypothetical protein [Gammaproteobacteria bacterium]MDD9851262.1 hypothetical protein [Gammaproteobacteria bacterium]MDD9871341.1 hypothetical protein [Gammaproteobacteria bacterium]
MKTRPAGKFFALGFFLCTAAAAGDVPNGCVQQLLDAQTARLSACAAVDGVDARRTGTLPGGARLYLVYEFPGGSGVFSSMVAFTEDNGVLHRLFVLHGGDRCDNGIKSARMLPGGGFAVVRNQTPLDLGTGPEFCATCCAGTREEHYNAAGVRMN